jgi:hypothetical protein
VTTRDIEEIIPPGRAAAAPTWRAWIGYHHMVFEQAEGATRDAAICALLATLGAEVGEAQWVVAEWCGAPEETRERLLVRAITGGGFEIVEVC